MFSSRGLPERLRSRDAHHGHDRSLIDPYGGGWALTRYGVRFTAQVWPGHDLSASATVTAIDRVDGAPIAEFSLETKNQDGVVVLSGSAAARLDP